MRAGRDPAVALPGQDVAVAARLDADPLDLLEPPAQVRQDALALQHHLGGLGAQAACQRGGEGAGGGQGEQGQDETRAHG